MIFLISINLVLMLLFILSIRIFTRWMKALLRAQRNFNHSYAIIKALDKRLLNLENEIRMQKSDSSRLIEWLDKRDREVKALAESFEIAQHLKEREQRIVQLGETLKLIRSRN